MFQSRFRRPDAGRRQRGRRKLPILVRSFPLFCLFASLPFTGLSAQLTADKLEVTIAPSSTGRVIASVVVHNGSKHAAQAILSHEDWDRAEDGKNRFMPAGTTPNSCGNRLSYFPASFRLEPGADQIVRLAAENSHDARKQCWAIVFVEEVSPKITFTRSGLQYKFRTGVKVYIASPGLKRDASITDMALDTGATRVASPGPNDEPPSRRIGIRFENSGELNLSAKGRLELRRADNSVASVIQIPDFPTLPGAARQLMVTIPPTVAAGHYVALAMINFGGADIAAGELEVTLK